MPQPTTVQSIRADVETMEKLKQIATSMGCTQGQALKAVVDAWVDQPSEIARLTSEITTLRQEILRLPRMINRPLPAWRARK